MKRKVDIALGMNLPVAQMVVGVLYEMQTKNPAATNLEFAPSQAEMQLFIDQLSSEYGWGISKQQALDFAKALADETRQKIMTLCGSGSRPVIPSINIKKEGTHEQRQYLQNH
jgi:hypothetical protein